MAYVTPNLGNGTGKIYVQSFPAAVLVLSNSSDSFQTLGAAYVTNPKAAFGLYANNAAPTNVVLIPEQAIEIDLSDLQQIARENLLGITPP
jgi:predicted aconitase